MKNSQTQSKGILVYQTEGFPKFSKKSKKKNYIGFKTLKNENLVNKIETNEKPNINLNNEIDDYMTMPYNQALLLNDNRKFFSDFYLLLFNKIDFLYLFTKNEYFKPLSINQFITSLILFFFFISFFYSDEIVSHNYHSNGKLNLAVTIALSFLAILFTIIIGYYLKRTIVFKRWMKKIHEIKSEEEYLVEFKKFLKSLKIQVSVSFFIEVIIFGWGFYYIVIFFIIYYQSRKKVFINFLICLMIKLILLIIYVVFLLVMRKISIISKSSALYDITKFIYEKF